MGSGGEDVEDDGRRQPEEAETEQQRPDSADDLSVSLSVMWQMQHERPDLQHHSPFVRPLCFCVCERATLREK